MKALLTRLPCAAALALGSVLLGCAREAAPADSIHKSRTSVLMLTLCTVRADHLGCYGYERQVTPTVDRLAREGFRFENVLAQAPWTRSSIAAIVTGMYPRSLNLEDPDTNENFRRLHPDFTTLAEILKEQGYRTIGVTANPNAGSVFEMNQGYDAFDDPGTLWFDGYMGDGVWSSRYVVATFLEHLKQAPADERFFGHLVLIDAHVPRRHKRNLDADDAFSLPPKDERSPADVYDLQLSFLDESIAGLLGELESMGRAEDLLIVINADHGEGLGDQSWMDRGHSRTVYNSTIWVPWILWHPSLLSGEEQATPRTRPGLVQQVDMLPTLLELLDIDPAQAIRGRSALAGTSRASDVLGGAPSEELAHGITRTQFLQADKAAVVTPEHKLILNFDHEKKMRYRRHPRTKEHVFPPAVELYRYRVDPREQKDLASRRPGVVTELEAAFRAWQESYPPLVPADQVRMSLEETRVELESLKALGYVGED